MIFRKQMFTCAGCGRAKTAKVTVPPEEARDPLQPPPDWNGHNVALVGQDERFGAIASVVVFTCSENCSNAVEAGQGVGIAFLTSFRAFMAANGAKNLNTMVDESDEDDEEVEYEDNGPQVPSA